MAWLRGLGFLMVENLKYLMDDQPVGTYMTVVAQYHGVPVAVVYHKFSDRLWQNLSTDRSGKSDMLAAWLDSVASVVSFS